MGIRFATLSYIFSLFSTFEEHVLFKKQYKNIVRKRRNGFIIIQHFEELLYIFDSIFKICNTLSILHNINSFKCTLKNILQYFDHHILTLKCSYQNKNLEVQKISLLLNKKRFLPFERNSIDLQSFKRQTIITSIICHLLTIHNVYLCIV